MSQSQRPGGQNPPPQLYPRKVDGLLRSVLTKEEYLSLVTRIIMHIKDKGSKKHAVGPGGVMGQQNPLIQMQRGVSQMGGPMGPGPGQMGMMSQMNPIQPMNQMGVAVMGQPGMVHQMQQPQLVQQMQPGMNQGPGNQMLGGMPQQQGNQQAGQQHQLGQQGQMMGQNQLGMGMGQGQIPVSQMQQMQNNQMGQMQNGMQMGQVQQQMQQNMMQGGNPQMQMIQGGQQVMMQQGGQHQQGMMQGGGQPQMMMQGQPGQQQQQMMQQASQAQQAGVGVGMQGTPQQQMMQAGQQQGQQPGMMGGPGPQGGPQGPGNQMMQVRGMPNPQMVGNRLMTPQTNVATALTQMAHAQQQRKAAQQTRPMVPPNNAMGIPRPEHGANYSMNRLYSYGSNIAQQIDVPVNVQFQGVGPGGGQMQQRPVGPFVQSGGTQGMPSPSPGSVGGPMSQGQPGFANSPGSQGMMHRPPGPGGVNVGSHSPFPNPLMSVPSPNTNLNTPMPMAPTPSPRTADDHACMEKIKELKKYTDLLQRMIAKAGNEDMEKSSKMKKLLEILTNPHQRVSMEILLKCEAALKKMERQQHDSGGVQVPTSVPTPQPKDQTSPFQQIQDAILSSLKNGSSSHTYLRTFRQSVEALTGQPFATSPEPGETEADFIPSDNELSLEIPGVLRRELKIIDNRFKVKVIRNPRSYLNVVIHVSLMESRLPRVPPLKVFIPYDYPDESPSVLDLRSDYDSTGFLSSVARTLKSRILNLPQRFTVLELLRCWEMSVRQVSNPHYKATAPARRKISNSLALTFL